MPAAHGCVCRQGSATWCSASTATGEDLPIVAPVSAAVAIGGALLALIVIVWFFVNRQNPESASSHQEPDQMTREALLHEEPTEGPAGPGAEDERVVDAGETAPGPSANEPD